VTTGFPDQLNAIPDSAEAQRIARLVRERATGIRGHDRVGLRVVCQMLGIRIRPRASQNLEDRHSGLLVPTTASSFDIYIRTAVSNVDTSRLVRENARWRYLIAHEIGHSFFYSRTDDIPRRLVPMSKREEEFCDEFAAALLGLEGGILDASTHADPSTHASQR
jgi:Zn-dependent peptidase ImmA (M78 family)